MNRLYSFFVVGWIASFTSSANQLVILNWPNYLPTSVIEQFEQQTASQVSVIHFESDENKDYLLSVNQGKNYDIVVSSLFRTFNYYSRGWLTEITPNDVPNLKHLSDYWQAQYEASNQHCAPYLWGSLGIVYNQETLSHPIASWQQLFNLHKQSNAKIKLLNDSRDVIGAALLSRGDDINHANQSQIYAAGQTIQDSISNISSFGAIELSEASELFTGKVDAAMAYNGDGLFLTTIKPELIYVTPQDGTILWLDCMTVTSASSQKKLAYQFINFIHQPEISAYIAQELQYATPNQSAKKLLPDEISNNPHIYPAENILKQSSFHKTLTPEAEKAFQTVYSQLKFESELQQ